MVPLPQPPLGVATGDPRDPRAVGELTGPPTAGYTRQTMVVLNVYRGLRERWQWATWLLIIPGALVTPLPLFGAIVFLIGSFAPSAIGMPDRGTSITGFFLMMFPAAFGLIKLVFGWRAYRNNGRLEKMASAFLQNPTLTVTEAGAHAGLDAMHANRFFLDLVTRGVFYVTQTVATSGVRPVPAAEIARGGNSIGNYTPNPPGQGQLLGPALGPAALLAAHAPTQTPSPDATGDATGWVDAAREVAPDTTRTSSANERPEDIVPVGSVLSGRYELERLIGEGGMGRVFVAKQLRTGRRYALKVLLPHVAISPDAFRRFEREATLASSLGHPGIIQVHDYDQTDTGLHYIVMDLLEGETVEQRIARGNLSFDEARHWILAAAAALATAHDQGLVHRDVKPANLFIAKNGDGTHRLVVLDFGVVKPMDGSPDSNKVTRTGAAVGTPLYMSPEQAIGRPVDGRSDLYSLGVVFFEMLAGAPPFSDSTGGQVFVNILTVPPPPVSAVTRTAVPLAFDALLQQVLAKDPAHRFANIRAFARALEAIR
jgi:serine/threonine-protein kinase